MSIIDDFMSMYEKQFDYFENQAKMVAIKIEEQLFKKGIKAIVTHRSKSKMSAREKIEKSNRKRKYISVTEIYSDIRDLAGARISLYFPLPQNIIDEVMNDAFFVLEKHQPLPAIQFAIYKNKFPGYHAAHYHVRLKEKSSPNRFADGVAEVQVGSTFMHAWAEIDHDLVYKPSFGKPSTKELAMLDEVNGLALSAEMSLKSLQHAMAERTIGSGSASDKYELSNLLLISIGKEKFKKYRLGDVYLLQYYLETLDKTAFKYLLILLEKINPGSVLGIADQLLYMLLEKYYHPVKNPVHKYLKKLHFLNGAISLADEFIGCWVTVEKRMMKGIENNAPKQFQYMPPAFEILIKRKILTAAETAMLENLYAVKNDLLHGIYPISTSHLRNCIITLKSVSAKIARRK